MSKAPQHRLVGLETDNLLAFMALVGLLRALDMARPEWHARVCWDEKNLPMCPALIQAKPQTEETIAEAAAEGADALAESFVFDRKDLNFSVDEARTLLATAENPLRESLLSSLMSDAAARDDGRIWPTPFCFLFGQGHQHFLERFANVPAGTLPKSLLKLKRPPDLNAPRFIAEALFAPWTRSDATDSFRWDVAEDRRYALRAIDPSGDPMGTQHGANRLAAVGLPVFSGTAIVALRRREMRFVNRGTAYGLSGEIMFTWPIVTRPTRLAGLRALLAHPILADPIPELEKLAAYGVTALFRARRLSVGKFFNVTPAERIE